MISWTSLCHHIGSREQLEAYKELPLAQKPSIVYVSPKILARDDSTILACPSLKALWINGQFSNREADVKFLFKAILQSQTLELLSVFLYGMDQFLRYHKLTLRSPVSKTLRLLRISGQYCEEGEIALLGRSLQFNASMENLSIYPGPYVVHEKYSRLFQYLVNANLRVLCNIPMNLLSFFCAGVVLPESKLISLSVGHVESVEPKRWWRYLFGAVCKLERVVSLSKPHFISFSGEERKFLRRVKK